MFGVSNGGTRSGQDSGSSRRNESRTPERSSAVAAALHSGPPAPAKHEYPNWEDAFSHRDFAFANESEESDRRGGSDFRRARSSSRSPSPIRRAEKKQPASKIDQYADAFEQFERGK